ncbi:hypothetical protein DM860_011531 [Cuscuta australis]|uniref:SHSP domain-containing protein n=1 Tax=Cuscuta australis TaxID=267555 RepID=A0A328CZY1_9ASTE|nr:hypothetical protein DM860_011531 [Cuscuta australis]
MRDPTTTTGLDDGLPRSENVIYEEVVPLFEWNPDSTSHYWLLLHVPGFRREDLRVEVRANGLIRIGGERKVNGTKCIWFDQFYTAPKNSKPQDSRMEHADGVLKLIIPTLVVENLLSPTPSKTPRDEGNSSLSAHEMGKNVKEKKAVVETPRGEEEDPKHEKANDNGAKGEKKSCDCLAKLTNMVKQNMGVFFAVILAFSFGAFVSQNKLKKMNNGKRSIG